MPEPANFADWTRRDSWRLWEAVALIDDMEPFPNFLERLLETPRRPNANALRWRDIVDAARESCESRDAPWFLGRCDVNRRQFLETPVHPDGFVQWALGKGFAVADELQPWRQRIDSREAEETDRARLDQLTEFDPAGRLARRRAARKLGLHQLSHWLTKEEVAELYGDESLAWEIAEDFNSRRLRYCVIHGRATLWDQDSRTGIWRIARNPDGSLFHVGPGCDGMCVHVANFLAWPAKPPTPEGDAGAQVRAWLGMAPGEAAAASESVPVEAAAASMSAENVVSTGCTEVSENVKSARAKLQSFKDAKKFSPRVVAQCEAMIDACESLKADPFCLKDGEKGEIEQRVSDANPGLFDKSNSFRVAYDKAVAEGILCHWRKEQAGRHHVVSEGKGGVLALRSNGRW